MYILQSNSYSNFARAILLAAMSIFAANAQAQTAPSEDALEAIIKSTLMTFNDANLSGNYNVLLALSAPAFRAQLTADKLAGAFKKFRDDQTDISPILSLKPNAKPAVIDKDGVLAAEGSFDVPKMRVDYTLKYIFAEGRWKQISLTVKTSIDKR